MKPTTFALASAALAALPAAGQSSAPALPIDRLQVVADSMAQVHLARIPGMTIAIGRNGEVVFARGYGTADLEMGVAAGPGTVYGITSITKQLTAAAILRLAESGRIDLDADITAYLPDYPSQGHGVTVRQLLNHTSGISAMRSTSAITDPQWFRRDLDYAQMVDLFGRQPFEFEPGEKHEYNNMAYYLAGEIIARVTGMPWGDYLEREVLQPLGLNQTVYCDANRIVPGRAETYARRDGQLVHAQFVSMQILGASGAFCSTVADMVRWSHLLHAGQVVSPASLREMTAKTVLTDGDTVDYGYGLYLEALGEHRKVFHGGTIPWGSYLAHYPEDGLTIAVLTNGSGARDQAAEIEEALARAAFGMEIPDLPLTAEEIAGYEGTYTLAIGERTLDIRVFGENGRLMAQATGQDALHLLNQGSHDFIAEQDKGIRLVFTVQDGRATAITLHQHGRAIAGARKP